MSYSESFPRRRFYRRSDKAVIAGVCAGLADYFGFNLRVTRILAVISLFMAMPITLIAYFGAVFLIPARSENPGSTALDDDFKRAIRASPAQTLGNIRRRYQSLDRRLARLERYVTSPRFNLDQEFRKL